MCGKWPVGILFLNEVDSTDLNKACNSNTFIKTVFKIGGAGIKISFKLNTYLKVHIMQIPMKDTPPLRGKINKNR